MSRRLPVPLPRVSGLAFVAAPLVLLVAAARWGSMPLFLLGLAVALGVAWIWIYVLYGLLSLVEELARRADRADAEREMLRVELQALGRYTSELHREQRELRGELDTQLSATACALAELRRSMDAMIAKSDGGTP